MEWLLAWEARLLVACLEMTRCWRLRRWMITRQRKWRATIRRRLGGCAGITMGRLRLRIGCATGRVGIRMGRLRRLARLTTSWLWAEGSVDWRRLIFTGRVRSVIRGF